MKKGKKMFLTICVFMPPLVLTYLLFGIPIKNMCQNGEFSWFPVPRCTIYFGASLEAQGFSSVIDSSATEHDCNEIERGWCVKEWGEKIVIDGITFQTATVTPKGYELRF